MYIRRSLSVHRLSEHDTESSYSILDLMILRSSHNLLHSYVVIHVQYKASVTTVKLWGCLIQPNHELLYSHVVNSSTLQDELSSICSTVSHTMKLLDHVKQYIPNRKVIVGPIDPP